MDKRIITMTDAVITLDALLEKLCLDKDDDSIDSISAMLEEAVKIARPTALYAAFAPETGEDYLRINGVSIPEEFVRVKLAGSDTVVPYVATCGQEIDQWSKSFTDFFRQFAADAIKEMFLGIIRERLVRVVKEEYYSPDKNVSAINPGSLRHWPIQGQRPLFEILGGVTQDIGVVLTDSMLMVPNKSVSGILFQSDREYHNCELCQRTDCPNRKTPYMG